MNNKQTAINWLIIRWEELQSAGEKMSWDDIIYITKLAEELEKQDIEDAYRVGKVEASMFKEKHITGEQYYNETYRGDIQSL
jgi:hypothetical protein